MEQDDLHVPVCGQVGTDVSSMAAVGVQGWAIRNVQWEVISSPVRSTTQGKLWSDLTSSSLDSMGIHAVIWFIQSSWPVKTDNGELCYRGLPYGRIIMLPCIGIKSDSFRIIPPPLRSFSPFVFGYSLDAHRKLYTVQSFLNIDPHSLSTRVSAGTDLCFHVLCHQWGILFHELYINCLRCGCSVSVCRISLVLGQYITNVPWPTKPRCGTLILLLLLTCIFFSLIL